MKFEFNEKNCIFLDFLYGKTEINVSNGNYAKYFKNPNNVTPYDLLYTAQKIADDMSVIDGVNFMRICIVIAAYHLKNKQTQGE